VTGSLPAFAPHPLLPGFHRQTLAAALLRVVRGPPSLARVVAVNDANSLRLRCSWHAPDRVEAGRPVLVMVHGLGGSADSPYMKGAAAKAFAAGLDVVRVNQRGADDSIDLVDRTYHSGLYQDVLAVVDALRAEGRGPFVLAGWSLGGNCVLRLAGMLGEALVDRAVRAVVAVSPSLDLPSCGQALDTDPRCRLYRDHFVKELLEQARACDAAGKGHGLMPGLSGVRTLRDFDDRWTARLHGFDGVDDYYQRASALPVLDQIAVPTLVVHARDDHLVPCAALESATLPPGSPVQVVLTEGGGHCGFLGRGRPIEDGVRDSGWAWAEHRVVRFAVRRLASG
jgi:hypothetical protein